MDETTVEVLDVPERDAQAKIPPKPTDKARGLIMPLGMIRSLYAVERRIREEPPEIRHHLRLRDSQPVLARLHERVED